MIARRLIALIVAACLIGASGPAFAQGGIAEINGVVLDQSQAVLPGVTVVVTNVGTSAERTVVTGPDGRFIAPTLIPGVYRVSVELARLPAAGTQQRGAQRRPGSDAQLCALG